MKENTIKHHEISMHICNKYSPILSWEFITYLTLDSHNLMCIEDTGSHGSCIIPSHLFPNSILLGYMFCYYVAFFLWKKELSTMEELTVILGRENK